MATRTVETMKKSATEPLQEVSVFEPGVAIPDAHKFGKGRATRMHMAPQAPRICTLNDATSPRNTHTEPISVYGMEASVDACITALNQEVRRQRHMHPLWPT